MLGGRHGRFYTDTFFASNPTLRQCKMAQLFTNDIGYTKVYPMRLKSETSDALVNFLQEVGIPQTIHADNAKELMEGKFRQICKEYHINTTFTEPHSPWQNRAEGAIRELKRHVHRKMKA
jgi:IS30 family transposase